jgi:DUF2993 family protein
MRTTLVVIEVCLLLLFLAGLVADGALARRGEREAAAHLAELLGRRPIVRVHGTPFITQALRGRYAHVEVSCGDLSMGVVDGATLRAHLYGLLIPPGDLLTRRVTSVGCEQLDALVLVPYPELARVSRVPGLALDYDDGRVVASLSAPLPGASQLLRASGQARLNLAGGVVWLRVRGLSVAGISLPGRTLQHLVPGFNVPFLLPKLPYGLRVDELRPIAAGLLVFASAETTVFAPSADGTLGVDDGSVLER